MRCVIDGKEVPLDRVAKQVMNFGQEIPQLAALPYRIELSIDELSALLDRAHRETQAELLHDAQLGDADELTVALSAQNWPDLVTLAVRTPELFTRYVSTYLFSELLDALATAAALDAQYQLNTLSEICVCDGIIALQGRSYATGQEDLKD